MMPQSMRLVRQAVFVASVERLPLLADGVGYARILSFQESTAQELKDAVLHLPNAGHEGGWCWTVRQRRGVFLSAVHVAEMFLPGGVIVTTDSPIKQFRKTFKSQNPRR
jgi:C-terminal processing protease CtpA/Prc